MPRVSRKQAKLNRERVVEVAAYMIRERGLQGVGVADVMAGAGLTHGGFYGQFSGKDALILEAFESALAEDFRGTPDTLIADYLSLEHVRTPGEGCPLAALANDVAREPSGSPVRSRFADGVQRLAGRVARRTPKASELHCRQQSLVDLSGLVGAVVLARAVDDDALANELIEAARIVVTR